MVSHRSALLLAVSHRSAQKLGATEPAVHQLAELLLAVCLPAVARRSEASYHVYSEAAVWATMYTVRQLCGLTDLQ